MGNLRKTVYVDMDDTINYYSEHLFRKKSENPTLEFPQSEVGFYLEIVPRTEGCLALPALTKMNYDVWIATKPSLKNLHCYTEKAIWVKKHLGREWVDKLIIIPDKALLIGNYLIDDKDWPNFKGEQIRFNNNWNEIIKKLHV